MKIQEMYAERNGKIAGKSLEKYCQFLERKCNRKLLGKFWESYIKIGQKCPSAAPLSIS